MKCLVICCLILGVMAEPPRFRARYRSQRQELAPTTESSMESTTATGPYPPSGWKPPGAAFTLPIDTTPAPTDTYGSPEVSSEVSGPYPPSGWKPAGQTFTLPQEIQPSTSYGAPQNSYGVPENTYGAPTTDNPQAETLVEPVEVQKSVGTYYILLPTGQLQRVETDNDVQKLKYIASLRLGDFGPIFVFQP